LPVDLPEATLHWLLRPGGTLSPDITATWKGPLTKGVAQAEFRWGVPDRPVGSFDVSAELVARPAAAAVEVGHFALHTALHERARLAETRGRVDRVQARLEEARARGLDGAYPLVSLTVARNFCDWIEEDLAQGEVLRAGEQIDAVGKVLDHAEAAVRAFLEDGQKELVVPRYMTSPIGIDGTSFIATVRWPDGREERRPVFFNGYGAFGSVRRDVEKLPDYGLNIIQVEFGPNSTLPAEDTESLEPIRDCKALLDRAAKANVSVNLLLSPHYFPQWAYEKWPEVGDVNGGFIRFSVDSPHTRAVHERHLRLSGSQLKGRPGLHSYCLSNEPVYIDPSKDPVNAGKWAAWLKARYADLAALNAAHGAQYTSFEAVPVPLSGQPRESRLFYDWCRFNNDRFSGWHAWMADVIHAQDAQIPVHAKTMNTHFAVGCVGWGIDVEQFGDLSQIAGNDSWKWYERNPGDWAGSWQPQNMHFDLQRSATGMPIFNSENHVIVDRDLGPIPGAHLRNVMWQGAIHGQGASTVWVWERTYDAKSDFAGSIMHRPECAEAHGHVALDLMRLAPEVTAFQRAPARIAVVYSIASLVYSGASYEMQLGRVYQALNFLGEKIDFITERQLAAGKAAQYRVIVAPGLTHLPGDALRGLAACQGLVLATGPDCLRRDDFGREQQVGTPPNVSLLPESNGRELRDALRGVLSDAGLTLPFRLREADGDAEAWGVEWQTAPFQGAQLVNLVNYTQKPQRVRLEGLKGAATNLLTGSEVGETLDLAPLEPLLLSLQP
jgi:hypothetical protein